ncbi:MAG: hypothetical protein ACK4ND_00900 [Cytophagaceae bacterium]
MRREEQKEEHSFGQRRGMYKITTPEQASKNTYLCKKISKIGLIKPLIKMNSTDVTYGY